MSSQCPSRKARTNGLSTQANLQTQQITEISLQTDVTLTKKVESKTSCFTEPITKRPVRGALNHSHRRTSKAITSLSLLLSPNTPLNIKHPPHIRLLGQLHGRPALFHHVRIFLSDLPERNLKVQPIKEIIKILIIKILHKSFNFYKFPERKSFKTNTLNQ